MTAPAATSARLGRRVAHGARTRFAARSRRGSIRRPELAKRAGSSTTQVTAQASTTRPAATPARPTNGMPVTSSPEIETSTMPAAVSAEWPALALARLAASSGS